MFRTDCFELQKGVGIFGSVLKEDLILPADRCKHTNSEQQYIEQHVLGTLAEKVNSDYPIAFWPESIDP